MATNRINKVSQPPKKKKRKKKGGANWAAWETHLSLTDVVFELRMQQLHQHVPVVYLDPDLGVRGYSPRKLRKVQSIEPMLDA